MSLQLEPSSLWRFFPRTLISKSAKPPPKLGLGKISKLFPTYLSLQNLRGHRRLPSSKNM